MTVHDLNAHSHEEQKNGLDETSSCLQKPP